MNRILFIVLCFTLFFGVIAMASEGEAKYNSHLNAWVFGQGPSMSTAPTAKTQSSASRAVTVIHSFGFPAGWLYVRDAAWDGTHLWVGENFNSRTYKLDPVTGNVVYSFYGPDSNPWGLAFDGQDLHSATITMYHKPPGDTLPDYVHHLNTSGTKLGKWEVPDSPDATPHGLAYDPMTGHLWLSDEYYDKIYELDKATGAIISSYTFPGVEARGLTWVNGYLYAIDNPALEILKLDSAGNVVDSVSIASLGTDPEGLTWDGKYFWVTENSKDKIYQIDAGLTSLTSDVEKISQSAGGVAKLSLDAGPFHANREYLIFSTVSGTSPGLTLPGGAQLPINWDAFTNLALSLTNTTIFQNFYGFLDANGKSSADFNTLGPFTGGAGMTISFAFAMDTFSWTFASNPVNISIIP